MDQRRSVSVVLASVAVILAIATGAAAQGNPTGTISGHVVDPDGLAVPGVTVTVASTGLQGASPSTPSCTGDYTLPCLPAGDYDVTFEPEGFQTVKRAQVAVTMAETVPLNVTMTVSTLAETITVNGTASEII